MKKILIIQTAFIGDVILATSLIEKIKDLYPDSRLDFLLRKGNESILSNHPFVNNIIKWDKKRFKYWGLFKILLQIRSEKYNLIINTQRFMATGIVTAFSGAKITTGFDKNPLSFLFTHKIKHLIGCAENNIHETERNLSLIGFLDGEKQYKPKLHPSDNDFTSTSSLKEKTYICISPASVWFTKQFPFEKWVEFINCVDDSFIIYLIGSYDDIPYCKSILDKIKNKHIVILAGNLSILETAALMRDAKMNFVNDSAAMHIASAMNAPVTAIYCSTIPAFGFGPLSETSYIVETADSMLCRPCGIHGLNSCPEKHFNCAFSIKTDILIKKIG